MRTRTFTRYFTDDSPGMAKLHEAFQEIESDMLARKPHLDKETALAMEKRVTNLMNAWYFMLEEVPW